MDSLPMTARIAQMVGIAGAAFVGGNIFSISRCGVPAFALAPVNSRPQVWEKTYDIGSTMMPPMAAVVALDFAYVAYANSGSSQVNTAIGQAVTAYVSPWVLFACSGVLVMSIAPYTIFRMLPTNNELHALADTSRRGGEIKEKHLDALLNTWQGMNTIRSSLPLLGAALAIFTTLM